MLRPWFRPVAACFRPIAPRAWRRAFGEFVRPEFVAALREMRVETPNELQKDALPVALRGDT